jgi:hypothetical protein
MSLHPAAPIRRETHSLPYNLGVLALAAALIGVALSYGIDAMTRGARPISDAGAGELILTRSLGGHDLEIPALWFRDDAERATGFSKTIALSLLLPLGPEGAPRAIAVTLMPRSQVRPSSSLLDGVYLHQFMPEQLSGPPGLIGKPLVAADGYANEVVWYDPISSNSFAAKCIAPVNGEVAGRCLRSVYLGPGIAAVYDFEEDVLFNWRGFDAELGARMKRIGAL